MKEDEKLTVFSFHEIYEGNAEIPIPQSHVVQRVSYRISQKLRILQKLRK